MSARVFTEYAVICEEHGSHMTRIDSKEDAEWMADHHNRNLPHEKDPDA